MEYIGFFGIKDLLNVPKFTEVLKWKKKNTWTKSNLDYVRYVIVKKREKKKIAVDLNLS